MAVIKTMANAKTVERRETRQSAVRQRLPDAMWWVPPVRFSAATMTLVAVGILLSMACGAAPGRDGENPDLTMSDTPVEKSVELLARQIEPNLAGEPARLQQYVDFFQRELGNDKRLFAFDVTPQAGSAERVTLQGYVEFPETRTALAKFLQQLGFAVVDELETLPSAELGDLKFGLVEVAHSHSFSRATGRRTIETDCLLGEPLYLLRKDAGHFLAHNRDGYLGFIRAEDVRAVDAAAFNEYCQGPRVCLLRDFRSEGGDFLPAGARLKWAGQNGEAVTAELPNGRQITLPADECEVHSERSVDADRAIDTATRLLGTRYQWGGCTSEGIDCSGLVQLAFSAARTHLPRDAYQQFYVGHMTGTRWHRTSMQRGDTLYFLGSDGKIRHTALYLGDDRYLHATTPTVRINSFNPQHADFDARRAASFAFARRPLE